jgi:UDP-N-acetylmuramoyl-L-alanyl-D-glutamate--2,6-diaminopimelate ligase
LHERLSELAKQKKTHVVLETSSHALALDRVYGCRFDAGVITNITHEHLELHGSKQQYIKDKSKLIEYSRAIALNRDDENFEELKQIAAGKQAITFGMAKADVSVTALSFDPFSFTITTPKGAVTVNPKLYPIEFNVYNCLAAASVALLLGIELSAIKRGIEKGEQVRGRMNVFQWNGRTLVVDFAHTPDSLEKVLSHLKKRTKKRVIVVFGSAGERDVLKRSLMGAIAAKLADLSILTNEDPRFEDENKILDEIAQGFKKHSKTNYLKIPDRIEAIKKAMDLSQPGDIILLAGKGHEQSIEIKGKKIPYDEIEVLKECIAQK